MPETTVAGQRPAFIAVYCAQTGLTPAQFNQEIFRKALFPHARLLAPLILKVAPRYFEPDLDFVRNVGEMRRLRDFHAEADAFFSHPDNRGPLRMALRLRISVTRLSNLMEAALHPKGGRRQRAADA